MSKIKYAFAAAAIILPEICFSGTSLSQAIYNKVSEEQVKTSSTFALSDDKKQVNAWQKQAGLFASYVKLNFVGGEPQTLLRNNLNIFDNNFFVTAWTLESLLASQGFGAIHADPNVLKTALQAELQFNDKNRPDTSLTVFWPQEANQQYWQCRPTNLEKILNDSSALSHFFMGVCSDLAGQKDCENLFNKLNASIANFKDAFSIPADADDTSLNLSLGARLKMNHEDEAYAVWRTQNSDEKIQGALKALVQYTYQPLSESKNNNLVDPRSYYAMHDYLDQYQTTPALITTWAFDLGDEQSEIASGFTENLPVAMPFNTNNVDPSVESNFIDALASLDQASMLDSLIKNDPAFQTALWQSVNSSAEYITWVINHDGVMKRPDITIVYYPEKYNLYLFASRILSLYANQTSAYPALKNASDNIRESLQNEGTKALLQLETTDGNQSYWDDFLGDADHRAFSGKPWAEDRLYSTAVVANTLLNVWTTPSGDSNQLLWLPNTPAEVKTALNGAIHFLSNEILRNTYRKDNVFFSGSVKGLQSLPFLYPANHFQYINGQPFTPSSTLPMDNTVLVGMQGYVEPALYQNMIQAPHFGYQTPTNFYTFNDPDGPFPFWSAPVLTYAFTLEAIVKYENLRP